MQEAVGDVFGYHAVQLGSPSLPVLQANRMPHRWLAAAPAESPGTLPEAVDVVTEFAALPFAAQSLDLLVLPHTLEAAPDPYAILREVNRVLVPEGKLVLSGLNPWSWWGVQLGVGRPWPLGSARDGVAESDSPQWISYARLRDWLRLLDMELEWVRFGVFRPACQSEAWLHRWRFMDTWGQRWWPRLGAAYVLVATKRVRGMRLLTPAWQKNRLRSRPVVVVPQKTPIEKHKACPKP